MNRPPDAAAIAAPSAEARPITQADLSRSISPFTTREKIGRLLWGYVGQPLLRCTFHNWYELRSMILRTFGAKIGRRVRIRATARFEVPWNLTVGDNSCIGDYSIVYSLGPITIGRNVSISQYVHLCAGTHDYTKPNLPLLRPPIVVDDEAWLAADVFIGPNVRIGKGAVVGARSSVFHDLPEWTVCVGTPAKPIKARTPTSDARH